MSSLCYSGLPGSSVVPNPPANAGDTGYLGSIPESGWSLEGEIATHFSILAWKIPWTEEPGGLQSMGLQRFGHDSHTNRSTSASSGCFFHSDGIQNPCHNWSKRLKGREFPGGSSVRLQEPNAGGLASIPGQGTRSYMSQLRVHMLQLKSCAPRLRPGD